MAPVDLASARPRYISAKEAVVLLDHIVTERDLQRWARQGLIAGAVRIGPKTIRFDRRSIMNLVQDLCAEPAPPPEPPAEPAVVVTSSPAKPKRAEAHQVLRWDASTDELLPERLAAHSLT